MLQWRHITANCMSDLHYDNFDRLSLELKLTGSTIASGGALQTTVLLNSLPPSFHSAVTSISMGRDVIPFGEVKQLLVDHAVRNQFQKSNAAPRTFFNP